MLPRAQPRPRTRPSRRRPTPQGRLMRPETEARFLNLRATVAPAPLADLPRLSAVLAEAQAAVALRLALAQQRPTVEAAPRAIETNWLKPEDAAAIAGVPVKRLYSWAQGKRWASRPSRKCLRI